MTALAGTNWTGTGRDPGELFDGGRLGKGATPTITPTFGGTGTVIATISGASTINLTSLLVHATT
jgi:hypothetical protein